MLVREDMISFAGERRYRVRFLLLRRQDHGSVCRRRLSVDVYWRPDVQSEETRLQYKFKIRMLISGMTWRNGLGHW